MGVREGVAGPLCGTVLAAGCEWIEFTSVFRLFSGGCRRREESNLFADSASEVLEGLLDVWRVIVRLGRVL